ncbi:MAG: dihydroorotase [Bacteroidetes bacterium]|nr:dihydroorotase [Bacteroidota bacterium]
MAERKLIKNALLFNEGRRFVADVLIEDCWISRIEENGISEFTGEITDAEGKWLLPGVIDDQVHFREPGFTHKAEIATESRAALAGGVTSFMEMPNVNPQTTTIELLEEKMLLGAGRSAVNYSFFLGATNHNLEQLKRINPATTCGVKIFMGSSTGDMLVDDAEILDRIFTEVPALIATHCENEDRVKARLAEAIQKYGEDIPAEVHPWIRDEEACRLSSSFAIELANRHNTRLHILHITTAVETGLFRNDIPLEQKKITSEVCVHHLHFSSEDYSRLGHLIKCNPAIKAPANRDALWSALMDDRLDIIATDHAPHTWDEKQNPYAKSPAGLPLVQHSLQLMLEKAREGSISVEKVVEKMCHAPAQCFRVDKRGYLREGYYADLVLVNPNGSYQVSKDNLLFKCGWSPLEGTRFNHTIEKVWVNGCLSWNSGKIEQTRPMRMMFNP